MTTRQLRRYVENLSGSTKENVQVVSGAGTVDECLQPVEIDLCGPSCSGNADREPCERTPGFRQGPTRATDGHADYPDSSEKQEGRTDRRRIFRHGGCDERRRDDHYKAR